MQPGGKSLHDFAFRAPPTLTYLNRIPPYTNHFHESDEEGDESVDNGPTGGLTWDGRVDTGASQAEIPLLAEHEMANTHAAVAMAIRKAPYADTLKRALGADVLDDDDKAFKVVVRALGAFEEDYAEFSPYTSKYDAFLTGRAQLSAQEKRGLKLFNDENKGNCAQCHISKRGLDGSAPALSDYGLIALAVPRNAKIPANHDAAFFDLGACGPERKDKSGQKEFCGLFRTPTLRNVALRSTLFPQWQISQSARCRRLLRHARHHAAALVRQGCARAGRPLRRPARAIPRQHQPRCAVRRSEAGRDTAADGQGDRRRRRVHADADRRLSQEQSVSRGAASRQRVALADGAGVSRVAHLAAAATRPPACHHAARRKNRNRG